jgi:hypothetical protein
MPADGDVPRRGQLFLKCWDILCAFACIYVAWAVPFVLGFEKLYNVHNGISLGDGCIFRQNHGFQTLFSTLLILDVIADVIFWIDIFVSFTSAVWMMKTEPMAHWVLVDDMSEIAKNYLHGAFFLDFLGSVPGSFLFACIGSGETTTTVKVFRVIRLTKLFRLGRIQRMIEVLIAKFPSSQGVIVSMQMVIYFVLGAHWCACTFFSIAWGIGDPASKSEYYIYLYEFGWAYSLGGFLDEVGQQKKFAADGYMSTMYWAVTTMSTIGYGDISPNTVPERIVVRNSLKISILSHSLHYTSQICYG